MKVIKWVLILLATLVFLVVTAVFILITYYKKEMTNLLMDELKTQYGLHLEVEKATVSLLDNWPHASLALKNIVISSEQNAGKIEPLIKARSLSLSLDLKRLLKKEFVIKDLSVRGAEINLIKAREGDKNFVFKKANDSTVIVEAHKTTTVETKTAISFAVNNIHIKDSHFLFKDNQRDQIIDIDLDEINVESRNFEDGIVARFRGEVRVDQLLFKRHKGAYLRNKRADLDLRLIINKDKKTLCIAPESEIEIEKEKYLVLALLELGETKRLSMIMKSPAADFDKVKTLLTPRIENVLSNFHVKERVKGNVVLVVNLGKRQDPVLIIDFESVGNSLTIGQSDIRFSKLNFKGRLVSLDSTGQNGETESAEINIYPITGRVYDFPFSASVKVKNLDDPFLSAKANILIEAERLDFKVARNFILQGSLTAKVAYSGPAQGLSLDEFLDPPRKFRADLRFNHFSYRPINDPNKYVVNGNAQLGNRDLKFDSLYLKTSFGEGVMKGKANNFMNFILGRRNGFSSQLAVRFEELDLNPLFNKKEAVATHRPNTEAEDDVKKENQAKKIEQGIAGINRFEFDVQLFARKLKAKQVEGTYLNADLHYKSDKVEVKSLSLSACEGKIKAKLSLEDFTRLRADVSATNVNITKMFSQFENFGQKVVVAENLQGIATVEAKFRSDLDRNMSVVGSTMASDVKIKIRDGHLINFEPVQKMSNLLFRNRDFNDVSFSELNETFSLEGYKMQLGEFEIASSVFDFFVVDGLYDFKGSSTINVLVPWSNLKRRGKNYVPKKSGDAANDSRGVRLNFSGPPNNISLNFGHKEISEP